MDALSEGDVIDKLTHRIGVLEGEIKEIRDEVSKGGVAFLSYSFLTRQNFARRSFTRLSFHSTLRFYAVLRTSL